jgi:predicted RNA-binding Zn ribbon-like protein
MGSGKYPLDALGLAIPDGSWPPGREAPDDLEFVRRFCNSQNLESGADVLRTPAELRAWLTREGFRRVGRPSAEDLARVLTLRRALRAMVVANHDGVGIAQAARLFDRASSGARGQVRLLPTPHLVNDESGVAQLVIRVADVVMRAHLNGSWPRLKACGHCGWVVYDHSRNVSVAWCSPLACGTRMKARAWRARQKTNTTT